MSESPLPSSADSAVEESPPSILKRARRALLRLTTRDPLLWVALAGIVGILLIDRSIGTVAVPGIAAVTLLTIFIALAKPRALLLLGAAGLVFATLHAVRVESIRDFPFYQSLLDGEKLPALVTGRVLQAPRDPRVGSAAIAAVREPEARVSGGLTIEIETLAIEGKLHRSAHRLRVQMDPLPPLTNGEPLRYGDRISMTGTLNILPLARNPGAFNPRAFYFRSNGAVAELNCGPGDRVELLETRAGQPLRHFAETSRAWLATAISRDLEDFPQVAAILQAMTLGAREHTPDDVEELFRLSGSLHIFAVSGMHVGIFAGIAWVLLSLLRLPRRVLVLLVIPTVLFYAVVTGLRPSACRAAIMASVLLLGLAAERQPRLLNSLGLAALVLLAIDTQQIFLPGFQLSFAVLAAIALLANPLRHWLRTRLPLDPFIPRDLVAPWRLRLDRVWSYVADLTALSVAAWIGSALLVIWHFHLLTPISILSNLLMVPLATLILAVACFSMVSSALHCGFLAILANNANLVLVKALTWLAAGFAAVPGGHFSFTPTGAATSSDSSQPGYADNAPLCRLLVLDTADRGAANIIQLVPPLRSQASRAAAVRAWLPSPGRTWLVDTASESAFSRSVEPALRSMAVSRLDGMILTHGDLRHIGGTPQALQNFSPHRWLQSALPNRSPVRSAIETASEKLRLPPGTIDNSHPAIVLGAALDKRGREIPIQLRILYPPPDHPPQPKADDQAIVLRLEAGPWTALLMSDAGYPTERWLLDNQPAAHLRAEIIVKGQHSQEQSGSYEFLRIVDPLAVVSTNAAFPANEQIPEGWRREMQLRGIALFDQSETGAVDIHFGSREFRIDATVNGQSLRRRSR
jgi:ComEC/Rec2-related protein